MAPRILITLAALFWVGGIGLGVAKMHSFESTAGDIGLTPRLWPDDSTVVPVAGRSTLVMLVHPECSCSRASLAELAQIMERSEGRVVASVLFVVPEARSHSISWTLAAMIPNVRVDTDPKGVEAARFGALTSGYVVIYDASGHLRFSGGITGARGHEGDNIGREQAIASIASAAKDSAVHSVFGCGLTKADEEASNTT